MRATLALVTSLILWYYVPSLLLHDLSSPPVIFTQEGLLAFALVIGILAALGYMFEDGPVGFMCGLGGNLATIVFLYMATDGGVMTFQAEGLSMTADFQPLLFLLILPSTLSLVRRVWRAVSHSVGRPTEWEVYM